jgi:hypothetical protein
LTAPFSDINITIEHQVAEGDMVMTWYWNYLGLVDR